MVLYDAMIVVSAKVPKTACADVLRRLGASVMDAGGVVTNVASYGARTLAYEFRRPGEKHFEVRRRGATIGGTARDARDETRDAREDVGDRRAEANDGAAR
jgi:small subunit ribosomal protein S6